MAADICFKNPIAGFLRWDFLHQSVLFLLESGKVYHVIELSLIHIYVGRVKVAKVDIDEHPSLAERYDVQSIPTLLLFKNGKVTARDVGAKPLKNYMAILDENL